MAADKAQSQVDDPFAKSTDMDISEEDRREVLKSIENIATENRISLSDSEAFALKGAKSGVLFPILVNLLSVAVVALVVFFLGQAFQRDTTTLVRSGLEFSSLEGQLLRELQKTSQDQISAKDQEITDYEQRLTDLELQRDTLGEEISGKVQAREAQYNQEILDALAAERARLESQGVDPSEVDRLLSIQERELRAFYSDQLAAYQGELLLEQEELQANINRLRGEYSQQIDELKSEREGLVEDFRTQELSLRTELEQQSQVIEQSNEAAEGLQSATAELARLETERQNAEAIETQLLGLYDRLQENLNRSDWEVGLNVVGQITDFLNEGQVASLSSLANRRSADLFVVATIGRYIENIVQNEENFNSISGQLEILSRIQVNNQRAITALEDNNETLVANIYTETMSLMPELTVANQGLVDTALNQLNEQFADELQGRTDAVSELIQAAETAIETGNYTLALTNFDSALQSLPELENTSQSINSNLVGMGYSLADQVVRKENVQSFNAIFQRSEIDTQATVAAINEQISAAVLEREGQLLAELSEAGAEISSLQEEYEDRLGDLSTDLTSDFTSQIDELNRELTDRNSELVTLREQRDEIEQRANALQQEVDRLVDFEQKLNSIQSQYSAYQTNVTAIRRAVDPDGYQAREALENFVGSSELNDIFPGLRNDIRLNYKPSEAAGRADGLNLAKDIVTGFSGQATPEQRRLYLETELEYAREDGDEIMEAFLFDLLAAQE